MNKKIIAPLQFITPDIPNKELLDRLVTKVCVNGCRWIQLRLKTCSDNEFITIGQSLRKITNRYNARLILNDRVHLVKTVNADGVHLGKNDTPVKEAVKITGNDKIIGATANTLPDCLQHIHNKVDYIGLGPFRFTSTKKNLSPVLGIEGYQKILSQLPVNHPPVIAIGGIRLNDIKPLLDVGVSGIAVSSAIANNPVAANKWVKLTKIQQ